MKTPLATVLLNESAQENTQLGEALNARREQLEIVRPNSFSAMEEAALDALRRGVPRIVAAGGDGTVSGLAALLARENTETTLGVLPCGTGNDFAASLGVRDLSMAEALDAALEAPSHEIDMASMKGRYLLNVASIGNPAEATTSVSAELKEAMGAVAYMLSGLAKAVNLQPHAVRVVGPEFQWSGEMLGMVVANGAFTGGGQCVAPKARIDDGLLDCVIVPALTLMELTAVLRDLLRAPETRTLEHLVYAQLPEVTVSTEEPIQVNIDGEPTRSTEAHFTVQPKALRVAVATTAWLAG